MSMFYFASDIFGDHFDSSGNSDKLCQEHTELRHFAIVNPCMLEAMQDTDEL